MAETTGRKVKICCITNRHLSVQDYYTQIGQIARAKPEAVIVREKDLPEAEYEQLAQNVMRICARFGVNCILHTYIGAAVRLGSQALHLPLSALLEMPKKQKAHFTVLGASVHSVEEAIQAQDAGASYLAAGHVFATDCKRGVLPRGLPFLEKVCGAVDIPVYALGGIHAANAAACLKAGAAGVCVMSECMKHADVEAVFAQFPIRA